MRRALSICWVGCLAACADSPTQTLVRFEADSELEERADAIRVRLFAEDGTLFYDESPPLDFELAKRRVPVEPAGGDASLRFRVIAELLEAGEPFATVRAETGFVEGEIREVWLRFEASCLPITCTERESCREAACGGDCVDPAPRGSVRPTPAYACAELDGGTPDASVDVPIDASVDAAECDCACSDDVCTVDGCVPAIPIAEVSLGRAHACAIDSMGRLWCWGDNTDGQVGVGLPVEGEPGPPVDVPSRIVDDELAGEPVTHVSLGDGATGARLRDGRVFTWGNDDFRKLGQGACCGDRGRFDVPNLLEPGWINVAYGADHACAIEEADQGFECWGRNTNGQCAVDTAITTQLSAPRGNSHDNDWIALSAGSAHTCGIRSMGGGSLYCWGNSGGGRLGVDGASGDVAVPMPVGSQTWVGVSAGARHTCGINDMAHLYCWGAHDVGQLGVGDGGNRMQPNRVPSDPDDPLRVGWTFVDTGYEHTCGIHDGALYCWGSNLGGALGVPSVSGTSTTPVLVAAGIQRVAAGDDFTCAIDELGALHCWGRDDLGRLGLARTGDRDEPARVCFSE